MWWMGILRSGVWQREREKTSLNKFTFSYFLCTKYKPSQDPSTSNMNMIFSFSSVLYFMGHKYQMASPEFLYKNRETENKTHVADQYCEYWRISSWETAYFFNIVNGKSASVLHVTGINFILFSWTEISLFFYFLNLESRVLNLDVFWYFVYL